MKKLYFSFLIILIVFIVTQLNTFAQAPEGFTYQAEARDSRGKLLPSTALTIDADILRGSVKGSSDWYHQYNVTTDKYGLFMLSVIPPFKMHFRMSTGLITSISSKYR